MATEIISNLTNICSNSQVTGILDLLNPILSIIGGIAGLSLIYLIIKFILDRINATRIEEINKNTSLILSKVNKLEKELSKPKKTK